MAEKQSQRAGGRTLVNVLVLLAIAVLVASIVVPNYLRSHQTASLHTCYFNQMWIEKAKAQWAHDHHKADTDVPTEAEVLDYMRRITPMWCGRKFPQGNIQAIPTCFLAAPHEKYILGAVGQRVRCPRSPHEWGGADLNDESFQRNYEK